MSFFLRLFQKAGHLDGRFLSGLCLFLLVHVCITLVAFLSARVKPCVSNVLNQVESQVSGALTDFPYRCALRLLVATWWDFSSENKDLGCLSGLIPVLKDLTSDYKDPG
jgi:hypothetical protein